MSFPFWPWNNMIIWICIGMVTILVFGMIAIGMVWLMTHMHNENCEFCERKMPIIQDNLMKCKQQLKTMNKAEMECKSQIDIMHKRKRVISNQVYLINGLRQGLFEVQRSADQYVADIEKCCELKATDDSWFYSLSKSERDHMYRLKHYLGVNEHVDKRFAVATVGQESEGALNIINSAIKNLKMI